MIRNPYTAILKIADGSSFDDIAESIEIPRKSELQWTTAIGGAFAILSSCHVSIDNQSKDRIREELEKIDRMIDERLQNPKEPVL